MNKRTTDKAPTLHARDCWASRWM